MVQMSSIFKDRIDCKSPSRIYSIFLKEQLCHFTLKRIREHKSYKLDTLRTSYKCAKRLQLKKNIYYVSFTFTTLPFPIHIDGPPTLMLGMCN